ncbi:amidohydrolase family protein [Streptomyces sp. NPDC048481]|uniref:amidohydrolase family protein n=1 Tax=Streptomyces sp. NPDC048481 TaxID=3365557 RepID=UPI0037181CA2
MTSPSIYRNSIINHRLSIGRVSWDGSRGAAWRSRTPSTGAARLTIVPGTERGINPDKAHGILPRAIADLAAGGMPPPDALATATSVATDARGLGGRKGRSRAGYDAGLVVVDGYRLSDIAHSCAWTSCAWTPRSLPEK